MTFLPSVVRAEYRGGFCIHLTFNDLCERTIDFRPWLQGPVFEALKDPAYFREFFVEGGTVAWPNGADIAPETLYEAATRARKRGMHRPQSTPKARVKRAMMRLHD
jgi:hypothetical protein